MNEADRLLDRFIDRLLDRFIDRQDIVSNRNRMRETLIESETYAFLNSESQILLSDTHLTNSWKPVSWCFKKE